MNQSNHRIKVNNSLLNNLIFLKPSNLSTRTSFCQKTPFLLSELSVYPLLHIMSVGYNRPEVTIRFYFLSNPIRTETNSQIYYSSGQNCRNVFGKVHFWSLMVYNTTFSLSNTIRLYIDGIDALIMNAIY